MVSLSDNNIDLSTMKKKVIAISIAICFTLTVLISLALITLNANPGGEDSLSSTDVRILDGGISSFWCDGQTIQSNGIAFNASVVDGKPRINPNSRLKKSVTFDHVPLTSPKNRVYWRFYLLKGSNIDITQCCGEKNVMGYVLRGQYVVDGCIYYSFRNLIKTAHNNCTSYWMNRELVRTCRGSKQMVHVSIDQDGYYLVLYQNMGTDDTYVSGTISLDSPTYDLSNSLTNCTSDQQCTLPLHFLSTDTVVASMYVNVSSQDTFTLQWTCSIRYPAYCVVFLAIPLVLTIIIVATIVCCRRRKSTRVDRLPSVEEPPTVNTEKEPLLGPMSEAFLPPTIDPRLRQMGPIPGPSAPPQPDDDQPFVEPTYPTLPPPPTYEESERQTREKDKQPEADAEMC